MKPITTDLLYFKGANAWKLSVSPVSVGFLYQQDDNIPLSFEIDMSKKGSFPFSSISQVKCRDG